MNAVFFFQTRHVQLLRNLSYASVQRQLSRLLLILLLLIAAHILAMRLFENMSWGNALWVTLTTVTTVGYGDLSAQTIPGRIATIVLLYAAGIAILAQVAALYFEFRHERKNRILNGEWSWDMENHIVFFNSPKDGGARYFKHLVNQLRRSSLPVGQLPILLVTPDFADGLPRQLHSKGLAHVNKVVTSTEAFSDSSLSKASIVVILCHDSLTELSDSLTFDLVTRVREANPDALLVAESVSDQNRARLSKAGANHIVRPIRSYPELLARTILTPGAEHVIEDLFDSAGEECIRYSARLRGQWGDIAKAVIEHDIGMPLAYADQSANVISNSSPSTLVNTTALYVLVRDGNHHSSDAINKLLSRFRA